MTDRMEGEVVGMECPEAGCDGMMELRTTRAEGRPFYGCTEFPACDATHGAHPDGAPLGVPADAATKKARQRAHLHFDRLWKSPERVYDLPEDPEAMGRALSKLQRVMRHRAYRWLAHRLGMDQEECHIGRFDRFHCRLVVVACRDAHPREVRAWWKRRQLKAWRDGEWPDGTEYDGPEFTAAEAARWE